MTTASDKTLPDIAIFPDLNIVVRSPAGHEYRGTVLAHDSQHAQGERWLQVQNLQPATKQEQFEAALFKQLAAKQGRPAYFPAESTIEPFKLNLNRIPVAKRTDKNADTLIGELWDQDGLWTVLVKPSKSHTLMYAGSLLPAKAEIENNPSSKIAKFRRPTAPGEMPLEQAVIPQGPKPKPK